MAINTRVEKLEKQMERLKASVHGLGYHVEELQRKSRGTTRANAQAAVTTREHQKLEQQVADIATKLDQLPANPGRVDFGAITQELTRLDAAIKDHYRDLQGQLAQLSETVGDHGSRISRLEKSGDSGIDFEKSHLELTHESSIGVETPWVEAFIIGAIAGVLCAWALNLWIAGDWNATKDLWASLIVAFAAFWIMASFERFRLNLSLSGKMVWMRKQPVEQEGPETSVIGSVVADQPAMLKEDASRY